MSKNNANGDCLNKEEKKASTACIALLKILNSSPPCSSVQRKHRTSASEFAGWTWLRQHGHEEHRKNVEDVEDEEPRGCTWKKDGKDNKIIRQNTNKCIKKEDEIWVEVAPVFHLNNELVTARGSFGIQEQVNTTKSENRLFDKSCGHVKEVLEWKLRQKSNIRSESGRGSRHLKEKSRVFFKTFKIWNINLPSNRRV